ncbi:hypothetical protein Q4Q35_09560 [Flavivirga aquimarina]|uniref:Uncharacterized protein n=1 Tax=Flavivirga aquimarina TaxID=2027862 RepID=A0ABT8WAB2_9FLAO|nr:hypothetical protein [Flavivirga aquimarina]MDO5970055.1 hypothetical protein [Flavivirga aquimarina]
MRKTIIFILGVIILQLNFSCKTQYSVTELNKNFTAEQIADLNKITEFFKSEMCLQMDSDFKTCYERTPHEYLEATGNGFWANINFEKQKKLYEQISESTFKEIWMFCKSKEYPNEKEYKSICANANGKYQKFLTDLGKTNPRIAKYAKRIWDSGDFYSMDIHYSHILMDKKLFDLNDPNIQLTLAIHYLSLNDTEKRKEKWIEE